MARVPVNDAIWQAARELLYGGPYRDRLRRIAEREVKSVDVDWWRAVNGVTRRDREQEKKFKAKLARIKAMADPKRNSSEHQRKVAEAVLAKVEAAGRSKAPHASAPGLEEYDREEARQRAAQTTKPRLQPPPANATTKKPRSADRHREPNRDRHRPGYMRDYMRRRRAARG
jgi:hypothetical protein